MGGIQGGDSESRVIVVSLRNGRYLCQYGGKKSQSASGFTIAPCKPYEEGIVQGSVPMLVVTSKGVSSLNSLSLMTYSKKNSRRGWRGLKGLHVTV